MKNTSVLAVALTSSLMGCGPSLRSAPATTRPECHLHEAQTFLAMAVHNSRGVLATIFEGRQPLTTDKSACVSANHPMTHGLWLGVTYNAAHLSTSDGTGLHGFATGHNSRGVLVVDGTNIGSPVTVNALCTENAFPDIACDHPTTDVSHYPPSTDWHICLPNSAVVCYTSFDNHTVCGAAEVCAATQADHVTAVSCEANSICFR